MKSCSLTLLRTFKQYERDLRSAYRITRDSSLTLFWTCNTVRIIIKVWWHDWGRSLMSFWTSCWRCLWHGSSWSEDSKDSELTSYTLRNCKLANECWCMTVHHFRLEFVVDAVFMSIVRHGGKCKIVKTDALCVVVVSPSFPSASFFNHASI